MMETHLVKRQDAKRSNDVSSPATSAPVGLKPGLLRTQIYAVYADTFAHLGRVFSATNADLRRRDHADAEYLNTPTIRRPGDVDAGLSLANSPRLLRTRRLLRGI